MLQLFYDQDGQPPHAGGPRDIFRVHGFADGFRIGGSGRSSVAMESLPPLLRSLLVTDGSVTKTLEAYFWEPVRATGVKQRVVQAEAPITRLGLVAGDTLLARHVALRGGQSGRHFANAFSAVHLDAIPAALRVRLLDGDIGIGNLIRSCGLESYRELLDLGMCDDIMAVGSSDGPRQHCVQRTYRIIIGGRPLLLLTECFALDAFLIEA